jgi:membrane-associated protease RseP (regulator of RpoE activity)
LTWFALVAVILVVAVEHELGHYFVARRLGIPVKLFAIGTGPVLWQRTFASGMRVELRAFPVGLAVGVPGRRDDAGRPRRSIGHEMALAAGGAAASALLTAGLLALAALLGAAGAAGVPLFPWLVMTGLLAGVLALLNLLPLPGLDGGHLFLLLLARLGWELSPQREARVHRYGVRMIVAASTLVLVARLLIR